MLVEEYLMKIKNTIEDVKIKPKNKAEKRFTIRYVKSTAQLLFKIRFSKSGPTYIYHCPKRNAGLANIW